MPSPRPLNLRTLLALILVAALLTVWHHAAQRREAVSLPERVLVVLGRPLQRGFTYLWIGPRNLGRAVVSAPRLVAENERLQRERDEAEAKQTALMQSYLDYRALVQSLGLTPPRSLTEGQAARVIALDTGPSRCRATLAVEHPGTIAEGDIVRQAAGLVGRVIRVEGSTAEVLLLIDPQAAVAGRNTAHGRDQGIIYPEPALTLPSTRLKMEKIKPISAFPDLRAGDLIESSGLDQVFPAGLPIGRIEHVIKSPGSAESVTAIIRPAVDFFRLEYVLVIPKQAR